MFIPEDLCHGDDSSDDGLGNIIFDADAVVKIIELNYSHPDIGSIDPSDYNFPNEIWHVRPWDEIIVKTCLVVPLIVIGVILNCTILLTICKNKGLWSPSNYLVANMALNDLLTLMTCPWMVLVGGFFQAYILGHVGCRMEGFTQASMLVAGVGSVLLVSYDRLAAVALTSEARVTKKSAPRLAAFVWIFAAAICSPLAFFREFVERQWLNYLESYCTENLQILPVFWHVIVIALVWLPLGLMIITYGLIIYRLERAASELHSRGGGNCAVRARGRAMRASACVLIAAAVCRLPFTWLVYWRNDMLKDMQINAVEGPYRTLWFVAHLLMYLNCALNPLIYGFTNKRFRRAMDRTPDIAWCRFASWCCVFARRKEAVICDKTRDKNTKVFVLTSSPAPNRNLTQLLKNILYVHADQHDFVQQRCDKTEVKSSKVTRLEEF